MSATEKKEGFTAEEKAAMRARAKELKAAEDGEEAVAAALKKMAPADRAIGKRVHELVKEAAPDLTPKTWYGMPAYANKDGKVVVYFRDAGKFKERYSMLATIREYARERLDESGEAEGLGRAHADFFLTLAESAGMSAEHDYGRRYDILPPEQENLRAAIDWLTAAGEIEQAFRLAIALENFWVIADPFEGMRRFEALLGESGVRDIVRARALRCYAGSSFLAGKFEQAQRANEESLALFRAAEDERGIAELLHRIGINALQLGESERAQQLLEESLALFQRLGSARGEAEAIGALGYCDPEERIPAAMPKADPPDDVSPGVVFQWQEVDADRKEAGTSVLDSAIPLKN